LLAIFDLLRRDAARQAGPNADRDQINRKPISTKVQ
jgi:hypothetical protein